MEEQNKTINEAVAELKGADETKLKEVINKWFEAMRMSGLKLGAQMISLAITGVIKKHLNKAGKSSLRDYQRCVNEINKIISVQLTQQNDSNTENETNE
jgi:hypothetical protein